MEDMGSQWTGSTLARNAIRAKMMQYGEALDPDTELLQRLKPFKFPPPSLIANADAPKPAWLASVVQHRDGLFDTVWAAAKDGYIEHFKNAVHDEVAATNHVQPPCQ